MPRTTMAELITRVRLLVGDPTGLEQVFTDDEIQGELDRRRTDVVECELAYRPSTATSGTVEYHDYWAPRGAWEGTVVLKNASHAVLTPTSTDLATGHWTFSAGQLPPVYITGIFYDVYGAAVAVLQAWQAKVAREFDFGTDGQTFDRSQKRAGLAALAAEYRRYAVQPGQRPPWRSATW